MKKQSNVNKVRYITRCAVFCALGALLPQAAHVFGTASGQTLLPMHIPAMLAGFLLGPAAGLITGLVSPLLSNLITGGAMPILIKVPFMMIEVGVYGLCCGLFYKLTAGRKLPELASLFLSLLAAQVTGRAVNVLCTLAAVRLLGVTHKAVSVSAAISSIGAGIPGIVIQWIFIPTVVLTLNFAVLHRRERL